MRLVEHMPQKFERWKYSLSPIEESIIPIGRTGKRLWDTLGDGELVACAKWHMRADRVSSRIGLVKKNKFLYLVLVRRDLLHEAGLPNSNEKHRHWTEMGNEELVAFAKGFISEKGISGREELKKADCGLYQALKRRKLRDEVGLQDTRGERRKWAGMGEGELVELAKRFLLERGVCERGELARVDSGIYNILRRRKLLDAIFADAETSNHTKAVNGVLDALESFGDTE